MWASIVECREGSDLCPGVSRSKARSDIHSDKPQANARAPRDDVDPLQPRRCSTGDHLLHLDACVNWEQLYFRMSLRIHAKNFVGKGLPDCLYIPEIEQNHLEAIDSCEKPLGL